MGKKVTLGQIWKSRKEILEGVVNSVKKDELFLCN